MRIISNNKRNMQEKHYPTTSQKILWELKGWIPPSLIVFHAKVTWKQIEDVLEGKQNIEVFSKLICFWSLLTVCKEEDAKLNKKILENEKKYLSLPKSSNKDLDNYSDTQGV